MPATAELVTLRAPGFEMVISGPATHPAAAPIAGLPACCESNPRPSVLAQLILPIGTVPTPVFTVSRHGPEPLVADIQVYRPPGASGPLPFLFESIDYRVTLDMVEPDTYAFEVDGMSLDYSRLQQGRFVLATANFSGNVGNARIIIWKLSGVRRRRHLIVDIAVLPLKLGYFGERARMIDELCELNDRVVLSLFRPATSAAAAARGPAQGAQWLARFREDSEEVLKTLTRIEHAAHYTLAAETAIIRPSKVRKPTTILMRAARKRGVAVLVNRAKMETVRKTPTVSTAENRYLKGLAVRVVRLGRMWLRHVRSQKAPYYQWLASAHEKDLALIEGSVGRIDRHLQSSFWQAVGEPIHSLRNRTNFIHHALFRRFEALARELNHGVALHDRGTKRIHTLAMEELYQWWAYQKLVSVTAMLAGTKAAPGVDSDAFRTTVATGKEGAVKITPAIRISAQRKFAAGRRPKYFSPFVAQKPDFVFELESTGGLHIFDAKYRIAMAGATTPFLSLKEFVTRPASEVVRFEPNAEDINTMHRYRDAIRLGMSMSPPTAPAVESAFILFPHRPTLADIPYYEELLADSASFSIGAIPLVPGIPDSNLLGEYGTSRLPPDPFTEQVRFLATILAKILPVSVEGNPTDETGNADDTDA